MSASLEKLSAQIAAFAAVLRTEHGFAVGQADAHDALLALDALGIDDETRARTALRLVFCAHRAQRPAFDEAFDRFFRPPPGGIAQPRDSQRHTRPGSSTEPPRARNRARLEADELDLDAAKPGAARGIERDVAEEAPDAATAWQALRARYSPASAAAAPLELRTPDATGMLRAAGAVVAAVRLGRSRRWTALERGGRFDLRRTLRASLQTGGDPIDVRYLGHPLRNPRFVLLIDGSRSMSEHTTAALGFARALCARSARAHAFVFSTELREITPELRRAHSGMARIADVGQAWGGGTQIGANLRRFVDGYGGRLLTPETLAIVCSDGLDVGDVDALRSAMRTLDRRCAAVVWLNPHAATAGYAPTARGMQAALPFITLLTAAGDADGYLKLARTLARNARLHGRRHA